MKRPSISLCMIVKNEAENLPRLFESIEGCYDEIHITDTGSTDDTVKICERYGAKVHHFEWINDFAAARNYSFSHASTDYIAWLDADDVLSDRKAFIQWRDHTMATADYWVATYHYAFHADGKPGCSFVRERVVKRSKELKWKYFVHEGLLPHGQVRISYCPTWTVNHMRTVQDLEKDHSRNLKLLEARKDNLDSRMLYYYGKELFENKRAFDATHILMQAVAKPDLEGHDRILGIQYCGYALMQCNQFEKAFDYAHSGMQLAPNRAEFHVIAGDCMIKLGRPLDAVPYYAAAKNCTPQGAQGASALFHHQDAYGSYPRIQLAKVYANLGQLDRADAEAREAMVKYPSAEITAIRDEVHRIMHTTSSVNLLNAKPVDDIVITTPPQSAYVWDGDLYRKQAMGGSETAAIEMAEWLHIKSGRPVLVFNMREQDITINGVQYISNQKVHDYMRENKPFLHIAWRHNNKLTDAKTFLWCHDLNTPGAENTSVYEKILALTPFHKEYLQATQGIPANKIHLTRNGITPGKFKAIAATKDPFQFIWPSSHDRGIERAIHILKKARETYPKISLHVFYGYESLYKYGLKDLADRVKALIEENKEWIVYHGATEQSKMIEEFKRSAYWLYPSDWIETSCITASEVLCSGVYPIVRAIGGVVDTLSLAEKSGMASLIDSDCITEEEHAVYLEAVKSAIAENAYKRVQMNPNDLSWEAVAEQWLEELPQLARE